jgi:hypothetical protein
MIATTTALFNRTSDVANRHADYKKHSTSLRVEVNAGPVSRGEDCGEK